MKYKILLPIAYGGRIEKGTVCELPEDVAKAYGPEYVVPADTHTTVDDVIDEKPLDQMTLIELKDKAKALNLSTGGSKTDLVERITLHTESQNDEEEGEDGEGDESDDESEDDAQ